MQRRAFTVVAVLGMLAGTANVPATAASPADVTFSGLSLSYTECTPDGSPCRGVALMIDDQPHEPAEIVYSINTYTGSDDEPTFIGREYGRTSVDDSSLITRGKLIMGLTPTTLHLETLECPEEDGSILDCHAIDSRTVSVAAKATPAGRMHRWGGCGDGYQETFLSRKVRGTLQVDGAKHVASGDSYSSMRRSSPTCD